MRGATGTVRSGRMRAAIAPSVCTLSICALCVLLAIAGSARAQDPRRGETVTERKRPELDPLGIRMGAFRFFPRMALAESYDDNIFATDTGEIDDYITVISPALQLRSGWNNHALNFFASADAFYYRENGSEDHTDFAIGTDGRVDVSRDTSFSAAVSYLRLHEDRTSVDDANGVKPTRYTVLSPGMSFVHHFGRFSLDVSGGLERLDFYDVATSLGTIINNDDRDRDEWEGTVRLGFEIVPEYEMFIRGTYFDRAYEERFDDNGFERSSRGYEAVLGTAIDLTGVTFGELFVGYRMQNPDDPAFDTIEGVQYGGQIFWNPSGLTTFAGGVERTIEETTLDNASGYFATRVHVSIDHELLRNLILGLDAARTNNKYEQISRDDDELRSSIYGKYLIHKHLYFSATYDYSRRNSNVAGDDYRKNMFMLRLQTQY